MTLGKASLLALALYLMIFPSISVLFNYAAGQISISEFPNTNSHLLPVIKSDGMLLSDTPLFYYNVTPAIVGSSGWVEVNYNPKVYGGDYSLSVGLTAKDEQRGIKITEVQEYANFQHVNYVLVPFDNFNGSITIYNVTSFDMLLKKDYDNYQNVIGSKIANNLYLISIVGSLAGSSIKQTFIICYMESNPKIPVHLPTQTISFKYVFTDYKKEPQYYMAWDWRTLSDETIKEDYKLNAVDKWQTLPLKYHYKSTNYRIRFWLEIPFSPLQYAGEYYLAIKPTGQTFDNSILQSKFYCIDPWWDVSWNYAIKITCDNTGITENMTDYPVMVYLNSSRIDWTKVQDDLDDLRFIDYDNSSTPLKAELEKYTTNTNAWIWVKLPHLRNYFFCYYGNAGATPLWDAENVWNANYMAVWHLNQSTGSTQLDSTANDNDGTPTSSPPQTAGQIDGSLDFDGSADYVNFGTSSTMNPDAGSFTIEIMVKTTQVPNADENRIFVRKDDTTGNRRFWTVDLDNNGKAKADLYYLGFRARVTSTTSVNDGDWHLITAVRNVTANDLKIYIDGILEDTDTETTPIATIDPSQACSMAVDVSFIQFYYDGQIDETRLSDSVRSQNWTVVQNRVVFDTYLTYGSEQSLPLTIINKSISPSSYSVPIDTYFNLSVYVAELSIPSWKYVTNITLFLQPLEETFYLYAFNNSGTWQWSITDTYNNGALNSTQCTITSVNASTVKVSFNIILYYNFTYSGINVNATSSTQDGSVHDNDIYHDVFTFNAAGGGSAAPTTLLMLIIAAVACLGIVILVIAAKRSR